VFWYGHGGSPLSGARGFDSHAAARDRVFG
jgi:hypothetical protein